MDVRPHSLRPGLLGVLLAFVVALLPGTLLRAETSPTAFAPAQHGDAQLQLVDGIPVAVVGGSPEEMGQQYAALVAGQGKELLAFPRKLFAEVGIEPLWPLAVQASKSLLLRAPERHQAEMAVLAQQSGLDAGRLAVANTLLELRRLGCSSLIVEPERSSTGGPIFGRNFDFPSLGMLGRYSLVTVYRPSDCHAFAAVGFPGLVGVLSGMNDAGLCVATLDVDRSGDASPRFEPAGVPLAFVFRQILEECESVAEAAQLLDSIKATTRANLAVCDRERGVVFEITPHRVVRRTATDGLLPCTNHFRAEGLTLNESCWRFDRLEEAFQHRTLDVAAVHAQLHRTNQGDLTLQTMVFEPRELTLHLAVGVPPSSAGTLRRLHLGPLLSAGDVVSSDARSSAVGTEP